MNLTCINCGRDSGYGWFCPECYQIKEEAYKKARELGVKTHQEVIEMRDKALKEKK